MNSTNNAIIPASMTSTTKQSRKAADISKSPHRPFDANEEDWPALSAPVPPPTPATRSQGSSKRGKTNRLSTPEESSQRKLDAFFALAKQPIISSPPKLSSLGVTRRYSALTEKPSSTDGAKAPDGTRKSTRSDPPADKDKVTPSKRSSESESDEEDELPLSNIKIRPKSTRTPSKSSTKKQRKSVRSSVVFEAEPATIQIVEPEEPPAAAKKVDHPFRTIVTATVRVDKVKDSLGNFIDKLVNTVTFLRTQVDDTIAIVPKSKEMDHDHIIDKASFPRVVYKLNQGYFSIETRGAFTDATKTQSGRTIKLSLVLGSTVEINAQFLEEIRYDTQELGVNFWYKPHQEVDTVSRLVFLGAPNNANKAEVAEIITNTLQPLEKHLIDTDPTIYPPDVFGGPWPKFAIVSEQPTGQPYTAPELGPDGKPILRAFVPPPSERRSLHIMCSRNDYIRLATLVTVAKAKNMWLKVFGMCYPVEAPDQSYSKVQGQEYLKMVDVNESAQLSYGTFRISGLIDPGKQYVLRRTIGEPITVSVRQIMRLITTPRRIVEGKVKPGEQVWLCVLLSDNGAYTGYYAGPNKKHQAFASTFAKCPAAQIYFFLCRHGILQQDVDKFIRNNFSMAQLRLVSQAKYNRRTGLATVPVQPGEENILDAARLDNSLVDLTKLTKREFEEDEEETEEYKGPMKNAPDCYKFDSTQSITTLQHATAKIMPSGKSVKSVAFGESVCSIDTQDDMEEDEEESNAAALALDPITKLRNEEVQFDLSYLEQETAKRPAETSDSAADEEDKMEDDDEEGSGHSDTSKSETTRILESQRRSAATDAALAAATVGLDLESVASETDKAELSFAIVLAGDGRTFQEMYDILDSLLEECILSDRMERDLLEATHTNVSKNIRDLLSAEAKASDESEFEVVTKIRNWLRQAEDEDAEDAGEDRYCEREYDAEGAILPRPEDYGDEEPQGCGASSTAMHTDATSHSADSSTARLGASTE